MTEQLPLSCDDCGRLVPADDLRIVRITRDDVTLVDMHLCEACSKPITAAAYAAIQTPFEVDLPPDIPAMAAAAMAQLPLRLTALEAAVNARVTELQEATSALLKKDAYIRTELSKLRGRPCPCTDDIDLLRSAMARLTDRVDALACSSSMQHQST
jgi:hypothetical protein